MDPITHLVAGGLAGAAISPNASWQSISFAAITALTPDFDFALRVLGEEKFQDIHRGPTHSLIGLGVLGSLNAIWGSLLFGLTFIDALVVALAALTSHLILDYILHGTGVEAFFPFSRHRHSSNLIMGLNPRVKSILCHRRNTFVCLRCMMHINMFQPHTYILLSCLVALFILPQNTQVVGIVSFCAMAVYLLLILIFRKWAKRKLQSILGIGNLRLFPAHPLPHAWLGVLQNDYEHLTTSIIGLGDREIHQHRRMENTLVNQARQTQAGLFFSKVAMVAAEKLETGNDETIVHLYDVSHYGLAPEELFSAQIIFNKKGTIIAEEFREKWVMGTPGPSPCRTSCEKA